MSEGGRGLVFEIKATRMGARRRVVAVDPTVHVEERWGRGTHGEARVSGTGRFLVIDVSNLGNHRCVLYLVDEGGLRVLEQAPGRKFCALCETWGAEGMSQEQVA